MKIRVDWFAPKGTEPRIHEYPGLEIRFLESADGIGDPGAVVLLDTRVFADLDQLFALRETFQNHVLVLSSADEVARVTASLTPGDDLLLQDSPPPLIAWHILQMFRIAAQNRDRLTDLEVRRTFLDRLEATLPGVTKDAPQSVLLVDIDHFKALNDEHGHSIGDRVLRELAQRIRACCSMDAFPARFSGDKLSILIAADETEAISSAEMIREAACFKLFCQGVARVDRRARGGDGARPVAYSSGVKLTVSVGVATTYQPCESREILRQVEEALYAAKAGGRNRAVHYLELEREALRTDEDIDLFAFENITRVIAERVASVITRRGRRLFREIRQQADIDSLTGLYSRRYLDRRLGFEFDESARHDSEMVIALIDIDFFGKVNKEHGWPSGDRVLADLSRVIRDNVRGEDWVARYGGEEFCLVMSGADPDQTRQVLERVREAVADHPFATVEDAAINITVSVGAVRRSSRDDTPAAMLDRVSDQLLAAKRGGRNRVCFDPDG